MADSTTVQIELLQERVSLLEDAVNQVLIAMQNVANVDQLNQIVLIKQKEWDENSTLITDLQSQIAILKAEVFK